MAHIFDINYFVMNVFALNHPWSRNQRLSTFARERDKKRCDVQVVREQRVVAPQTAIF